jgi:putative acetyltransferase
MIQIIAGDLSDPRVIELLQFHFKAARAQTAPGSAHALDLAGLQSPDISLWTIWDDETLVGIGALRRLTADHGEVKSMHTQLSSRADGESAPQCASTSSRQLARAAVRA